MIHRCAVRHSSTLLPCATDDGEDVCLHWRSYRSSFRMSPTFAIVPLAGCFIPAIRSDEPRRGACMILDPIARRRLIARAASGFEGTSRIQDLKGGCQTARVRCDARPSPWNPVGTSWNTTDPCSARMGSQAHTPRVSLGSASHLLPKGNHSTFFFQQPVTDGAASWIGSVPVSRVAPERYSVPSAKQVHRGRDGIPKPQAQGTPLKCLVAVTYLFVHAVAYRV